MARKTATVYEAPDGARWVRTGTCNQCGRCCEGDPFNGTVKGEVEGWCPYFRWVDGKGSCVLHGVKGSYWSRGCNVWPTKPKHLSQHPYCSFQFERVEKVG